MRRVAFVLACVGVALAVAGCDPVTERRYITEGAGVDLYTADRAQQIELQKQYMSFVCEQADISCPPADWMTFVQAGMNDIDQRCDGFLTWLDARRRDKEPVLNEITAISTATHSIMNVTGASQKSLGIVVAAFGLATDTYTNWNSRLLLAINQSTVQEVVYTGQQKLRDKIGSFRINDQPSAIYVLRNYLRLCMPTTIEATVNISAMLVQRDAPVEATQNTVVKSVTRPITRISTGYVATEAGNALTTWLREGGIAHPDRVAKLNELIGKRNFKPKPQVQTFLIGSAYMQAREEIARELNLIH